MGVVAVGPAVMGAQVAVIVVGQAVAANIAVLVELVGGVVGNILMKPKEKPH